MKLLQTGVFVLAGLLAGTGVWAAKESTDPQLLLLKEELKLTPQQTEEVDKALKESRAKKEAIRKEMKDIGNKTRERINAVLTPEQAEKYKKMLSEPPPEPMEPQPSSEPQPHQPKK